MAFQVKELFYTLQGEGLRAGRAAVFCRFAGCNLWSGREEDRATARCRYCDTDFRGTDGPGGGVFADEAALVAAILATFPAAARAAQPYVVFTGGEPALQVTAATLALLHGAGVECGVESNGTLPLPPGFDWITISPKAGLPLTTLRGQECKVVWPQPGAPDFDPETLRAALLAQGARFEHWILQPCDPLRPDSAAQVPPAPPATSVTGESNSAVIRADSNAASHVPHATPAAPPTTPPSALSANAAIRACVDYCLHHPAWRLGLQTHKFIGVR